MIKLNLGSNDVRIPGFINIDIVNHENVDVIANVLNLPYENNSIDEILASHIIEHFHYFDGLKALKEWNRVLKTGAIITVECPNLLAFCELYPKLKPEEQPSYLAQLFGHPWNRGQIHLRGHFSY